MRVLMCCDADERSGLGHLMRTLTLAEEALTQGWEVTVAGHFSVKARDLLRSRLQRPATIIPVPHDQSSKILADQVILGDQVRLVHVDSYSNQWDSLLADHGHIVLSNMEDDTFGIRPSTLSIDANLDAELRHRTTLDHPYKLLGVSSTLIRDQVKAARSGSAQHIADRSVLLVMGGSDPTEATPKVLRSLRAVKSPLHLTVIAPARLHRTIFKLSRDIPGTLTVLEFVDDLPALMLRHKVVISAAGTTIWDCAYLGVPTLVTYVTENQRPGYSAVVKHAVALGLGDAHSLDDLHVVSTLEEALSSEKTRDVLTERGRSLVDGLGAWRVVSSWKYIMKYGPRTPNSSARSVDMRPATVDDAEVLFSWRNDERTRVVSQNAEPVEWDTHVRWLLNTLADPNRQLFIATHRDQPVGTARWDQLEDRDWEVSITVAPHYRGRSFGADILAGAELSLRAPSPIGAIATIHEDNVPSLKLFTRAGYLPHHPVNEAGFAKFKKWLLD